MKYWYTFKIIYLKVHFTFFRDIFVLFSYFRKIIYYNYTLCIDVNNKDYNVYVFYVTKWSFVVGFLTNLFRRFSFKSIFLFYYLIQSNFVIFIHFYNVFTLVSLRVPLLWTLAYQAPDGEPGLILYSSTIMKIWDLYAFS